MESDAKRGNVHNAPPSSLKFEVIDEDFCIDNNNFSSSSSLSSPLQDFHHLDHLPVIKAKSSFDTDIDAFDPFFHGFDLYEDSKPNYDHGNGNIAMQSFHGGGFLNFGNYYRKDPLMEMDAVSIDRDHPNPKALSTLVPDHESSRVAADNFHKNGVKRGKCSANNSGSELNKKPAVGRRKMKSGKGQWTPEEDRLLIHLVEKYGEKKWSRIAQLVKGRIGKQCRERWHNHLRPDIKVGIKPKFHA